MQNSSAEIVFVLTGLNDTRTNKQIYFVIAILTYLSTIFVNFTLIMTILLDKILHEPMYIFLCSLCFNGIYGATAFYPKILVDLLSDTHIVSYNAFLTQSFAAYSYVIVEMITLTAMAYDRYVATCKPLHYHSIMSPGKVRKAVVIIWLFSFVEFFIEIILIMQLPLCGSRIDKLYCTDWDIAKLSCIDPTLTKTYGHIMLPIHISQALLVIISYIHIIRTCVRSKAERSKFMETCLPHMVSLINFVVASQFDIWNARYSSDNIPQAVRNIMSIEFFVVPPLLNPLIYGLKLKQIQKSFWKQVNRKLMALK